MKNRTKAIALILALVLALGLLAACGQKPQETPTPAPTAAPTQAPQATEAPKATDAPVPTEAPAPTQEPEPATRKVTDVLGRELEVPSHPQAMVITGPVMPNIVYALQGNMYNVVAIPKSGYTGWEKSLMRQLSPELEGVNITVVSGNGINMEELTVLKPDLVLCWDTATDTIEQLDGLGIPAFAFHAAKDLDTLADLITMMGYALNCEARAKELTDWYDEVQAYVDGKSAQVEALSEDQRPRVLIVTRLAELGVETQEVNMWIVEKAGGTNIILTDTEQSSPSMEKILEFNPEIIFLSNWDESSPADLYENRMEGQDWSQVDAVINHRVYKVPISLYRWVPPQAVEKPLFYLYICSIIQPEIFAEVDIRQAEIDFIREYFGVDLTEEQLDYIFHADMN